MLLKALADHAPHVHDLPPANYRPRTVRWCITVDRDGRPLDVDANGTPVLSDLADAEHKNGIQLNAPYVYRSGAKPPPTLLVDTLEYVLAMPKTDAAKDHEGAVWRNEAYIELLHQWAQADPSDSTARAVLAFFDSAQHRELAVPKQAKPSHLVAVNVAGAPSWPHLAASAQQCWANVVADRKTGRAGTGICLSCGQKRPLLNSLPESVKAGTIPVPGTSQARDAQLVSVNKPAQGRGGRIQLADIPLCEVCGTHSTAVLNALLADKDHRYQSQDAVTVWWLKDPTPVPVLGSLLSADPQDIAAVYAELHKAHNSGHTSGPDVNTFYAITLSAHQSRVVVRDWINVPLVQALERITQWFDDHELTDGRSDEPRKVPLWLMVRCLGRGGETPHGWRYLPDSEPVRAARDLLNAALRNTAPPRMLLQRLNQRIGADGRIDHPRAALLRLLYNRTFATDQGRVHAVLDDERKDPAYVAGRLFAVLEYLQYRALRDPETHKGPNATIADKVLASAKATPRARMEPLLDKSQAHLRRLRNTGTEKDEAASQALFDTICRLHDLLDGPLPSVLDQKGQSLFSLGYYQQHSHDRQQRRNATTSGQEEEQ